MFLLHSKPRAWMVKLKSTKYNYKISEIVLPYSFQKQENNKAETILNAMYLNLPFQCNDIYTDNCTTRSCSLNRPMHMPMLHHERAHSHHNAAAEPKQIQKHQPKHLATFIEKTEKVNRTRHYFPIQERHKKYVVINILSLVQNFETLQYLIKKKKTPAGFELTINISVT